jgi:hypothetical protein
MIWKKIGWDRRQGPLAGDGPRPALAHPDLCYRDRCNRRAAGRSLTTPQSGPALAQSGLSETPARLPALGQKRTYMLACFDRIGRE